MRHAPIFILKTTWRKVGKMLHEQI